MQSGDVTNNVLGLIDQEVQLKLSTCNKSFFSYVYSLIEGKEGFEEFTLPNIELPREDALGLDRLFTLRKAESFFDLLTLLRKVDHDLFILNYTFNELVPEGNDLNYKEYIFSLELAFKKNDLYKTLNGRYLSYENKKQELTKLKSQLLSVVSTISQDINSKTLANNVLELRYQETKESIEDINQLISEEKGFIVDSDIIHIEEVNITMKNPFIYNLDEFFKIFWLYMLAKSSKHGSY